MDISKQVFLVVGTGISGTAAAELLLTKGCRVYLYDGNEALDTASFYQKNPRLQEVTLWLGSVPEEVLSTIDIAPLGQFLAHKPQPIHPTLQAPITSLPLHFVAQAT